MAKIDIGKTLKKTLNEAGNATKKVAETVRDTAKEIDKDKVKEIFKKRKLNLKKHHCCLWMCKRFLFIVH